MPTYGDETLHDRYAREHADNMARLAKMKPEQIAEMELDLHNALAEVDRLRAQAGQGGEAVAWREHSVNYAKGEKCPETIETLQAAWDRDQELINDMRHEIARHKTRINRLEQRRPADQVADDLTMVKVSRELLDSFLKKIACHPGMLFTPIDGLLRDYDELRALLAKP